MDAARLVLHRRDFLAGMPATEGTVRWIGELVRSAAVDARIRQRARELTAGLPPFDHDGEMAAVWHHVLQQVRYLRDPEGVEYITDPVELDRQVDEGTAAEDCEGMIAYALSLLASMGIPSIVAALGFDPKRPERYSHCAAVIVNPRTGRATWFDPVGALEFPGSFGLGDTVHRDGAPLALWDLQGRRVPMQDFSELFSAPAREPYVSLRGVAFGDVDYQSLIRQGADAVKGVAPALGPYGILAAGLVQVGEFVYDQVTGEQVGRAVGTPVTVKPPPPGPTPPVLRLRAPTPAVRQAIRETLKTAAPSSGGDTAKTVGAGLLLYAAAKVLL